MKAPFFTFGLRLVVFQLGLLLCRTASAGVGFTVTPSLVSNTYSGPITVQVTGLTAGDTVLVQKFLDANADGVINAGDILWQQFNLTDGQGGMVIGGVTNNNVPGDTDTVPGQITAKLNFQTDFSQTVTGKYLFRLSSPSGHFAPMTNSFTVTSFPYAQKFSGTVATTGVGVSNAAVILFQSSGGSDLNPVGGAAANSSGVYTIPAPPGAYLLVAFKSNFVANAEAAANLVLTDGATFNTNLSLIAATQTISGRVFDTNNSSIGLPGLLMAVQSMDGFLGISFTDSNGNFAAGVNPNQWKLDAQSGALALLGYVGLQNKTKVSTASGSVSGVSIALPKATALFYGTIKDSSGNPLTGEVAVYAQDQNSTNNYNGSYQSDGYADTNGNYVTGVVGSLDANELWYVSIDNAGSFPGYIFSQPPSDQNGGTNMAVGQVVLANFSAILATNEITGNVKFNGNPVVGVQVNANTQDANNYQAQATTDNNGDYTLLVANGAWYVNVDCQGNNGSLDSILGNGNYQCPCGANVTINNKNGAASFTVLPNGGSGGIFGYVTNTSGVPIAGVNVYANSTGCNGNGYTTATTANGYYSFSGLQAGDWDVSVDCGGLNALGYQCVNDTNVTVGSGNVEQNFVLQAPAALISGRVVDNLGNPVANMNVFAFAQGGGPGYGATTDSNGNYQMGVSAGTFDVQMNTDPSSGAPSRGLVGPSLQVNVTKGVNIASLVLVAQRVTGSIAASVTNTSGPFGVAGINLSAGATLNGTNYSTGNQATGPSGTVSMAVCNGSWNVSADCNGLSGEGYNCPNALNVNISDDTGVANFTVTSASSTLGITTGSLTDATAGVSYANQLQASGGAPPYNWTLALGSQPLPSALTLSTNGLVSGVPAASGTNSFIIQVADNNSASVTRAFTLITNPNPRPGVSSAARSGAQFQFLLNGAIGQNYTVQASTNLNSTNWISLFVTNNAATGSFLVIDPKATNSQGFYRILVGP